MASYKLQVVGSNGESQNHGEAFGKRTWQKVRFKIPHDKHHLDDYFWQTKRKLDQVIVGRALEDLSPLFETLAFTGDLKANKSFQGAPKTEFSLFGRRLSLIPFDLAEAALV